MSSFCPSNGNSPLAPWNQEESPDFFVDSEGTVYREVFYDETENAFGDEHLTTPVKAVFHDDFHDAIIDAFKAKGIDVEVWGIDIVEEKTVCEIFFESSEQVKELLFGDIFTKDEAVQHLWNIQPKA